jgi:hypothetical protein
MENSVMSTVLEGVNSKLDAHNAGKHEKNKVRISKMNIVVNCGPEAEKKSEVEKAIERCKERGDY